MAAKPVRLAFLDGDGNVLETMPLTDKTARNPFTSGSVGYSATGKTVLRAHDGEDRKFQISCSVVEVNSKNEALAVVAAEIRSKKQQLQDQINQLQDQAKHLA